MIKAFIFDFDGVLVESIDIKTSAFRKLFESEGTELTQKIVQFHTTHSGVSRFDKFRFIYKEILKRELTDAMSAQLCERFSQLVMKEVIAAAYVSGSLEFIKMHMRHFRLFVCSATPEDEIRKIVECRKMSFYFNGVYGSPAQKSEIVGRILQENKLKNSEVVYVGDAISDYRAATDHSVCFIARIYKDNEALFSNIDCPKIPNLTLLDATVQTLSSVSPLSRA